MFSTGVKPRFRGCVLLAVALFASLAQLVLADPPPRGTDRFLFIVDVSTAMKKWDEPVREAVFDLIYSGVRGYMTNGDSYGVWLAGEVNDTSASVEVWRQKFSTELASRTAMRVKDHGFKGKPALDLALADAARIARDVGSVTVILISNGDTPLRGTGFDTEINAAMAQVAPAMKQAKATINTTLVARDGKFAGWAMNSPDFLVVMPNLPPPPPPTQAEVAAQKASASAAETAAKSASAAAAAPAPAPRVAPPRVASKPIVITRETVGREKEAMRALASTMETSVGVPTPASTAPTVASTRLSEPTNVVAPPASAPVVAAPPAQPAASNTTASAPIAPPPAESAPAAPAKIAAPVESVSSAPTKSVATVVQPVKSQPVSAAAKAPGGNAWIWALAGSVATAVIGLGILALRRNRSVQTSLVSEAMAIERLQNQRS